MIEELEEAGLTSREAACYLALCKLGVTTTGPLVNESGIPSSKIYEVLERLEQRGLASHIIQGKVKNFQASPPRYLLNLIQEKKKKLEGLIPILEQTKPAEQQSTQIFHGQKALFSLLVDLIEIADKGEEYLVVSLDEENKSKERSVFFRNISARRHDKKLKVKMLKKTRDYIPEEHTKLVMRYTDIDLPEGLTIFRDYVILLSWTEPEPQAICIKSRKFSDDYRKFFNQLWKRAKPRP